MAIISEVRFAHEDTALADTMNALPELDVTVVRDARTLPENSVYVIRFEGGDLEEIERVLQADHTVQEFSSMPEFEDQPLLGIEFAPQATLLNPKVTNEGGFVIEARSSNPANGARGWHERWLLPTGEALRNIWEHARETGFDFEVLDVAQQGANFRAPDVVTDQQREALEAACRGGYFAEPREMSLEELADSLDLSSSAAAGRLRRGMKSLIGGTLITDEPQR